MKEEKNIENDISNQELGENPSTFNIDNSFISSINKVQPNTDINDIPQEEIIPVENKKLNDTISPSNRLDEVKAQIGKIRFKYQIINSQGNKVNGYIDAYNKEEVEAYLNNEGSQIIKIDVSKDIMIGSTKLRYSNLSFILTQLSTYLKAGIPLIDAVRILEKQSLNPNERRIFSNITYELVKGESFSNALEVQGNVFPKLLINMAKTAEMTGDLPSILDDMADYYTTVDKTRKQTVSAMTYPTIIFIFSIAVVTFILVYVIPTFVDMFKSNNAQIPGITQLVINVSNFLTTKGIYLVIGIAIFLLIYSLLFKKVKGFRKAMQTFYMKLPFIKDLIIYKEVAMFTKTFASLLEHNVFITDSMSILSQISSNEVYSDIINESLEYLSKGAKISDSFRGKWAFPVVAYEMLVTGENTGKLPTMMSYVAGYYDDLYSNYVKRLNTFLEPLMIVFLAIIVGIVVLSVVIPMFSFYSQVI